MDLLFKNICSLWCIFLFLPNLYAQTPTTPIICDQEYALCTSARCIPTPGSSTDAICDCVVEKGKSAGYKSCEERKPRHDQYNVISLISTFSFAQFTTKRPMNCSKGLPWTNCVDMPCTIDPQNSKRALCKCTIDHSQAFFTFGGECNTNTCATGFWSGATPEIGAELRKALIQNNQSTPNVMPKICGAQSTSK